MNNNNDLIEVNIASGSEEKQSVYRFRYNIHAEETDKGIDLADHEKRMLYDDMDEWGVIFYACKGQDIIATLRLNIGTCGYFSDAYNQIFSMRKFQAFSPGKPILSMTTQFMILPRYRGSQVAWMMAAKVYEYAREAGVKYSFCMCAPEHLGLYEQLGYCRYTRNHVDNELGYRIPLVLALEGTDYLKSIRSPLYRLARKLENHPGSYEWFIDQFPEALSLRNIPSHEKNYSWEYAGSMLGCSPSEKIGLLKGLGETEAQKVLQKTSLLKCRKGDTVIRNNTTGSEAYILLSGSAELRKQVSPREYLYIMLEPGEIFGEDALLSGTEYSASVTALTDMEVLVLSRLTVEKLSVQAPETVSQLLHNLSSVIHGRTKIVMQSRLTVALDNITAINRFIKRLAV